ncbi:MAG: hypothetical protein AAGD09_20430 [Cyanobacteria bacterium P01_F01_bin.56]
MALPTQSTTLSQFFETKEAIKTKATELSNSEQFQAIKQQISEEFKGIKLPKDFYQKVFEKMLEQLDVVLSIEFDGILANAWSKRKELLEYKDREQYPPEVTFSVPLIEHTVTSTHHPALEPVIAEKVTLGKITFDVNLTLELEGVVLDVKDGHIMKMSIGSCVGKGTVGYGGIPFLGKEQEPIVFPGEMDLEEGVAIQVLS